MSGLDDLLKIIADRIEQEEEKNYVPVAKLDSEDIMRRKVFDSEQDKLAADMQILIAKCKTIKSQLEANHLEFWNVLHKKYNLPRDFSYKLNDEQTVLKKPKKCAGGVLDICICGECDKKEK